jgi:allantoate deiminase
MLFHQEASSLKQCKNVNIFLKHGVVRMQTLSGVGERLMQQADQLATFSDTSGQITRTYLSPEHRLAGDYLIALMKSAGMAASYDVLGNVVGICKAGRADAPTVMIGSHLDSVRNAGRYDGLFGILSAIACVQWAKDQGIDLPCNLEIVGFGDEEGVRFGVTLIGSKAMAGQFDERWLLATDAQGISMAQALRDFGGDPTAWASVDRRGKLDAYLESHIEQGPVLLREGLPLGVVTAIAGTSRIRVGVTGLAGHAGTVPMMGRQDGLTAASEMVLAIETHCLGNPGLVGTVGVMQVKPGAINVIPQDIHFTIDVRSGDDALRVQAVTDIHNKLQAIAARRNVKLSFEVFYDANGAPCNPGLQKAFANAITALNLPLKHLPSGAGHDAMAFQAVCPQAMLFVRCGNNGISHHPDETMTAADAQLATQALMHVLMHFDQLPR